MLKNLVGNWVRDTIPEEPSPMKADCIIYSNKF